MTERESLLTEFIAEGREITARIDADVASLGDDATRDETAADGALLRVFRAFHTLKGNCGFLQFTRLESLLHAAETLLSDYRANGRTLPESAVALLLATLDAVRGALDVIGATGNEPEESHARLVAELVAVRSRNPTTEHRDEAGSAKLKLAGALESPDASIRVDVGLLDRWMNLVGELVLVRNRILQSPTLHDHTDLFPASQRLNSVTTELQEEVMRVRLQPLSRLWAKLPRVIRELAQELHKKVEVTIEGATTSLDNTLLDALRDPFVHLLRNAIDHGLEAPAERIAAGKSEAGQIRLRAFQQGGFVHVEIADDGRGIDIGAVRAAAVQRGALSTAQAAALTEREALALVFEAGFSTATEVTRISGRGVGLDVVKSGIERLGGTIEVHTARNVGTTFRMKVPLTLAIIRALIVQSGGDRYAIPQASLLEVVRLEGGGTQGRLETLHDASVYRLREMLLPLVYLGRELGVGTRTGSEHVVVLQSDMRLFGLVVDDIGDTEEIVVKPLGEHLEGVSVYAGATILGDGAIALILDVAGLAQRPHLFDEVEERGAPSIHAARAASETLLVFESRGSRMALPAAKVARLEVLKKSDIETVAGGEVVQYRGGVLPLVHADRALPERRRTRRGSPRAVPSLEVHVVVCADGDRRVGLVVDEIIDTVETTSTLELPASRAGVLGATVIRGRVTELLDVDALLLGQPPAIASVTAPTHLGRNARAWREVPP